jgi:hypothetical protein
VSLTVLEKPPQAAAPHPLFTTVLETTTPTASLSEILDDICMFLQRFMSFSDVEQAHAISLWVVHTYVIEAFEFSPYLHIYSPEKRCGKSRLLDCLEVLTANPWQVASPSAPVLFRKIEQKQPTLLWDEVDTVFTGGKVDGSKEDLRGLLNAGFERRSKVPRCVGPNMDVKDFAVFCPKALAGIGRLPDTVHDRCIPIRLVRKRATDQTERFRKRQALDDSASIRDMLSSWAQKEATISELRDARPIIPERLGDRQTDICEPLIAIADYAGGEWAERARKSLEKLCGDQEGEDDSLGVKLLQAIRSIFAATANERLSSADLLKELVESENDGPWASWWERDLREGNTRGPAAKLSRLLKQFNVKGSHVIRIDENRTARGYMAEDFREIWERYCPVVPKEVSTD